MDVLIYIGIIIILLAIIPKSLLWDWMRQQRRRYINLPHKMQLIMATYRKGRRCVLLMQSCGAIIFITGCLL